MKNNFADLCKAYRASIIKEDVDVDELLGNAEAGAEAPVEDGLKCVCFKTADQALIDALQGEFSKITVVTSTTDDNGEVVENPVDFAADLISDIEVSDASECTCDACDDGEEVAERGDPTVAEDTEVTECGDPEVQKKEGEVTEDDEVTECGDPEAQKKEGEVTEEDEVAEEDEVTEEEDFSKWLDDKGVCVKCGDPNCKGDCKCKKCGKVDCIGDC